MEISINNCKLMCSFLHISNQSKHFKIIFKPLISDDEESFPLACLLAMPFVLQIIS